MVQLLNLMDSLNRNIRHFIRDEFSGLLVDKSEDISRLHTGSNKEIKKTALFN